MPEALTNVFDLTKNVGGILVVVFYFAIVLWTYKDARRRIEDPILVATSVATAMLPIVGVLIYMMLRPPEYIADARERELEIRAMERELGRQERCPYCKSHIESSYLSCPVCMTKLRQSCSGCDHPLDPRWAMCPFCETEVPRAKRPVPTGSPKRGTSPKSPKQAARTPRASKPAATKPTATKPSSSTPKPSESTATPPATDTPSSMGIRTEPFQAATPNRITGGTQRSSIDQPAMAHPVIPAPEK